MSIDFLSDVLIPSVLALGPLYFLFTLLWPAIPTPFSAANPVPTTHADGYTWIPLKAQEALLLRDYTPRELEPFNGKMPDGRILLAIKGTVFDVTAGGQFYGPDGPYGNFAGRDASRGMAKQSFELDMLTPIDQPLDKLEDLTPSEIENMEGWIEHFSRKYTICGRLVDEGSKA